jgi:hypothetical protein
MSIEARPLGEPAHDARPGTNAVGPLWKRLAWFAGLWAAGVATVGGVAYLLRLWIHA